MFGWIVVWGPVRYSSSQYDSVLSAFNMTAYCLLVCVRDSSTTRYDSELTVPFDLLVCSAVTKVSGASVQCDVARVEWSRRHCTSADGLDWRQGSLSQWSWRRCWDSLYRLISWAIHCPPSLGPTAFSHWLAYNETHPFYFMIMIFGINGGSENFLVIII